MENEPDTTNVAFIDEYPHLIARRDVKLALSGLKRLVNNDPNVFDLPEPPPDDAA